ncbi:MAG: hypothetical protein OEZ48_11485 [Candidatus Bathyarchaeota archaeon]|nr:hypothetical protein [Candidatus Bathyarchaeota archaeon]MDH5688466.1 hypothetical protein [Candidatus Bathyarchaeota archaeon]
MNRFIAVLLLSVTICSAVLGVAAAKANQRIVPHEPIMIQLKPGATGKTPRVETLKIESLMTTVWERVPKPGSNPTAQGEFEQGEIMGVFLNFSYVWSPPEEGKSWSGNWEGVIQEEDEYLYFNAALCAHFVATLTLYDYAGKLVAESDDFRLSRGGGSAKVTPEVTIEIARRGYCVYASYGWEPGTCTLKARIEELLTGLVDTSEIVVTILVGPPPEGPNPISIHPKEMIIGSDDLPDGWTVVAEDLDLETIEGYGMSIRYLRKPAGTFSKDVQVHIIQYGNVEVAMEYFEGKLEGVLSSEKYGSGKAVILDIADGAFLNDQAERRALAWHGWNDSIGRATGSYVVFRKENVIVHVGATYNLEALKEGIYATNEEVLEFAEVQAAKISAKVSEEG